MRLALLHGVSVRWLSTVSLLCLLSACTLNPLRSDHDVAEEIARPAGLAEQLRPSGAFVLTTRERIGEPGADVTIYIEGDGAAWIARTQPSNDPTPDNPLALRLAALDPAANVAWVARPCQYTPMASNPECDAAYWTGGRFAEKVVASMDAAVSTIKQAAGAMRVHLVGYSGGGGIAMLLAARRNDVASVRTLAANLNHRAFTTHHRVSPMDDSLNPADFEARTQGVAQLHLVGGRDEVVPELIARSYLARISDTHCANLRLVPGVTHNEGWEAVWIATVREFPSC